MDRKNFTHQYWQTTRFSLRIPMLCMLILLFSLGILYTTPTAYAEGAPGGNISNPVVRAVDMAKPSVVRIITSVGGRLTVHFPTQNNTTTTFPRTGNSYKVELSGSGAFISAHGDILTADHVMKPAHDAALDQALQTMAAQDVADYINQNLNPGDLWTRSDALSALQSGYLLSRAQYESPTSKVYLSTDYTGPLSNPDMDTLPSGTYADVDTIKKESDFNQKDIAIIHVAMENTPSIELGDSSNVAQQDELTIISFPGNGDVSEKNAPTPFLTSSVNKIYVSALKQTDAGAQVIQVGGNVEHGDSGGPALDRNGNIVGVVSFGGQDMPDGTSFLQASNSAKELMNSLNLDTRQGAFQKQWKQAFSDYTSTEDGHWQKAHQGLQKLQNDVPQFHAVEPYLNYAKTQAEHENEPSSGFPAGNTSWITWLGVSMIALALLATLFVAFYLRRKRATPATISAGQPVFVPNTPPVASTPAQQVPAWQNNGAAQQQAPTTPWPAQSLQQSAHTPALPTQQSQPYIPVPAQPQPMQPVSPYAQASQQSIPLPSRPDSFSPGPQPLYQQQNVYNKSESQQPGIPPLSPFPNGHYSPPGQQGIPSYTPVYNGNGSQPGNGQPRGGYLAQGSAGQAFASAPGQGAAIPPQTQTPSYQPPAPLQSSSNKADSRDDLYDTHKRQAIRVNVSEEKTVTGNASAPAEVSGNGVHPHQSLVKIQREQL